jgi:polyketide synthase PksN
MDGARFSAWLIGENSLVVECGSVLQAAGHEVRGIVSPVAQVRHWAAKRGMRAVEHGPELAGVLSAGPYDHLFSVVNMRMLPPSVLSTPRGYAINFHDALLPRDAGVHAATWAVLNGATRHGVTWHMMSAEADAGDIVARREFAVPDAATSYSVNVACWQEGLESFRELTGQLASGKLMRVPQDRALRTYHGRLDRPDGGLIVSWRRPAAEISRLTRAADFGQHPNSFGVIKMMTGTAGACVLVHEAAVAGRQDASARPGTVVSAGADALTVAAADEDLRLTRFTALDGTPLTIAELAARYGIRAGAQLPDPGDVLGGSPGETERAAVGDEAFWLRRLTELRPLQLPLPPGSGIAPRRRESTVEIPVWVTAAADPAATLVAGALAYLAELTGESGFDVGVRTALPANGPFADVVPLRAPSPAADFAGYTAEVALRLGEVSGHGTYLRDVFARYPALAERSPVLPVVVAVPLDGAAAGDAISPAGAAAEESGAALLVRVSASGGCALVTDDAVVPAQVASSLAAGFGAFLAELPADGPRRAALVAPAAGEPLAGPCGDTAAEYPSELGVHQLFARQARLRPGQVALIFGDEEVTYSELAARSGRLASYLSRRGAGPGTRVGVYLERSADLLVALLAVLRTGAAYVPLDPVYPATRIAYMLADADVALLVIQASLEPGLADATAATVVLDRCRDEILAESPDAPDPGVSADDLAYVIYTSGSTGQPKGVQVRHRGLTNFLSSMAREPGFGPADKLLAITTTCFDIAALELFLPLAAGGTVEIAPAGTVGDGDVLRAHLARSRPTVLQATPVTWKLLVNAGWAGDPALTGLCGGEALPRDLADKLLARTKALWNLYGPTETTIWSTAWPVRPGTRISIGTPIANTCCHVLDAALRPVPLGFPGELYIGGDGVAAGYRGRPALTAERFVDSPPGTPAHVIYRTGDLVRQLPDHGLEYLSRADHQIKLHGHRIEPGEIETVLRDHRAVQDAIVVLRAEDGARPFLAGYLIPAAGAQVTAAELRSFLRSRLPAYMIPAALITMAAFPETPNGKIDRKALPAPAGAEPPASAPAPSTLAPSTPAGGALVSAPAGSTPGESALQAVRACTATVLGQAGPQDVDPGTSFPDLGIDSLGAAEIAHRLATLTGVAVTVATVFRCPTPSALATYIGQRQAGEPASRATDITADAVLADEIKPAAFSAEPGHVLLTGSTGFVGAFLLRELTARTDATIHCLVRAADAPTAAKRQQRVLEEYGLWTDDMRRRLHVHPADLTRPLLGLDSAEFGHLARVTDAVYHSGAHVNAVLPYPELKAANVAGTQEALRLAAQYRPSAFHHVSTIEVFAESPGTGAVLDENHPAGPAAALRGGYAQTKWVSEQLVRAAAQRGLPALIYRLPRILGDRQTGACQTRDLLWQILRGCIQARAFPADVSAAYDLAPVDYVSAAILALSRSAAVSGTAYHLTNPHRTSFSDIVGYLRDAGYPMDGQPLAQWTSSIRDQPGNAAIPVLDIFLAEMTGQGWSELTLSNSQTVRALGAAGPSCQAVAAGLFGTYIRYFRKTGYLPMPGADLRTASPATAPPEARPV